MSNSEYSPKEIKCQHSVLDRCNERWHNLFFGVWRALANYDRKLIWGLMEELKRVGLADKLTLKSELFELNPSDEIIERTKQFKETAKIPSLRGKTRRKIQPAFALHVYGIVYGAIRDLPRKGYSSPRNLGRGLAGNIKKRYWDLKDRLAKVEDFLPIDPPQSLDGLLNRSSHLPNRQIAVNVTAHLFRIAPSSLKRILSQAGRQSPKIARMTRKGLRVRVASK